MGKRDRRGVVLALEALFVVETERNAIAREQLALHRRSEELQQQSVDAQRTFIEAALERGPAEKAPDPIVDRDQAILHLTAEDARRTIILRSGTDQAVIARKRARILAIRMDRPFVVDTDHGAMGGAAGDWLVMNHPDDDPGRDAWPLSAERFNATYEVVAPLLG